MIIHKIHRTHYILEDDKSLISFNPEKTSVENMLKGNFTVAYSNRFFIKPEKSRNGKMIATETKLAYLPIY